MSKNQNSFNPTEDSNKVNFGLFIKKHREKKRIYTAGTCRYDWINAQIYQFY